MAEPSLIDPFGEPGHQHAAHVAHSAEPGAPAEVSVFVHDHNGNLSPEQSARIDAAIAELNRTATDSSGLRVRRVGSDIEADVHVHNDASSGCGGRTDRVLGCAEFAFHLAASGTFADGHALHQIAGREAGVQAEVTLIGSWPWYAGTDSTVPSGLVDYQSVVTQELAHVVGLDHDASSSHVDPATNLPLNGDGRSAMFPSLGPGQAHRQLSDRDLADLRHLYGFAAEPETASGVSAPATSETPDMPGDHPQHEGSDAQHSSVVIIAPQFLDAQPLFVGADRSQNPILDEPGSLVQGSVIQDGTHAVNQAVTVAAPFTSRQTTHDGDSLMGGDALQPVLALDVRATLPGGSSATDATILAPVAADNSVHGAPAGFLQPSARAQVVDGPASYGIDDVLLADQHWMALLGVRNRAPAVAAGEDPANDSVPSVRPTTAAVALAAVLAAYYGARLAESDAESRTYREFLLNHLFDGPGRV